MFRLVESGLAAVFALFFCFLPRPFSSAVRVRAGQSCFVICYVFFPPPMYVNGLKP